MLTIVFILLGIGLVAGLLKYMSSRNYQYFNEKGLKCLKSYPLFGSNLWMLQKKDLMQILLDIYSQHPEERIVGGFDFFTPFYLIRDPKLAKHIAVKDFDHFTDRRNFTDPESDEIFGNVLTAMKGERWKEMRSSLSPAFTGSKMRLMFELIADCCRQLVEFFQEDYKKNGVPQVYEIKDTLSRYTNDVVASCAFGVKCDSLKNPNNEFYRTGQSFLDFQGPLALIKLLLLRFFPNFCKRFNISVFNKKLTKTFTDITVEQMQYREEKHIVRPDMINMLMELKKGNLKKSSADDVQSPNTKVKTSWSDNELVAQSLLFFLAGFETTSTFLQFLAYELAKNLDVQTKLIEEIDAIREELQGRPLMYDVMQKMKYLDAVINETLRLWPPGPVIDRICVKDYKYSDANGLIFTIEKDQVVTVPIYSYHLDPNHFADPRKFDPERFSEENKRSIDSDCFIPFGIGPRNCIGSRFALMETKALIYFLLSEFTFEVCEETQIPMKFKPRALGMIPDKKIKLALKPRQSSVIKH